jgi:hypothetical protein
MKVVTRQLVAREDTLGEEEETTEGSMSRGEVPVTSSPRECRSAHRTAESV